MHSGCAFAYPLMRLLLLSASRPVAAQDDPDKPVKLVVPSAAGGPADALGRILGDALRQRWGRPILIENPRWC